EILRAHQVGVLVVVTLLAGELGLANAIGPLGVPTAGTAARRVARVHARAGDAFRLGLVDHKGAQLGEAPGVEPSLPSIALPCFHAVADVRQVLEDEHSTRGNAVHDAAREDVIAVSSETVNLPGGAAEVPTGRASAFRLEFSAKTKVPRFNLPPSPLAKEPGVRGD